MTPQGRELVLTSVGPGEVLADLPLAIARHICGHPRRATFRMRSIAPCDLQGRSVRCLRIAARQKDAGAAAGKLRLDLGLNQSDLAAVPGAIRSRVTDALPDLAAEGASRRKGPAVICHPPKLRALSDDPGDAGPVRPSCRTCRAAR